MLNNNIYNCKNCGRIYVSSYESGMCPKCQQEQEKLYLSVRRYLRDNPQKTAWEVAEFMNLDLQVILNMVRQGKLISNIDL